MVKQAMETVSAKNLKRKWSTVVSHLEPKTIKKATTKPTSPLKSDSPKKKTKKTITTNKKPDVYKSSKSKTLKKKKRAKETTTVQQVKHLNEINVAMTNILQDEELVQRFRSVPMSNNQKGRIRQALRNQLLGSDNNISTELISGKIQAILRSGENLKDSDLRKIRILYNMFRNATNPELSEEKKKESKKEPKEKKEHKEKKEPKEKKEDGDHNKNENDSKSSKKKGPKRYVVFLGNLPLEITKERIQQHFAEISSNIKDVRVPKQVEKDDKKRKSAIAFMEVSNKVTYEAALSKHHSMLDNKRINVTFTLQENSKLSKSEAKVKSAKLVALQKAGKLAGSTALSKKRSHRRNIMKRARAKETALENA